MRKIVSLFLMIIVTLLNSSCAPDGRGYNHSSMIINYIDEFNFYCDKYYILDNKQGEYRCFTIYDNISNNVVDEIILKQKNIFYSELYILNENTIYIFGFYKDKKVGNCYYKTIGTDENIETQVVIFDDTKNVIQINDEIFFIYFEEHSTNITGSVGIFMINAIQTNGRNLFYISTSDYNEIYNIDVKNEEVVMSNYYNETIKYTYKIPNKLKNATYTFDKNLYFDDWSCGVSIREKEISKNSYSLLRKTTKLMSDGNLYFVYGRYLGEFEKSYCFHYNNCILSNRICEILRFNTKKKEIESVALIPETYTVLAIYEECAIIMNNERIGTYYYDTNEIRDSIEVDIAGIIYEEEYKWPEINAIKFYFKDKKIEKYVPYKSNNMVLNLYSNVLFAE